MTAAAAAAVAAARYNSLKDSQLVAQQLVRHTNHNTNKAVIDRRLRPRCCHLGSYFKRPKSSPVRPLAGITAHSL